MSKDAYRNPPPQGDIDIDGAPKNVVRKEFAKRLQNAMLALDWSQSELARQAAKHSPNGRFGRDNVSAYVRGISLPGPLHLKALAKALRVTPESLLPHRGVPSVERENPAVDIRDAGQGKAWLRINQAVERQDALRIMQILKGENDG